MPGVTDMSWLLDRWYVPEPAAAEALVAETIREIAAPDWSAVAAELMPVTGE